MGSGVPAMAMTHLLFMIWHLRSAMFPVHGGTKYWISECDDTFEPFVGQHFQDLEDAAAFYMRYAKEVRFQVRRSTQKNLRGGAVYKKHFVCNREGYKNGGKPKVTQPVGTGSGSELVQRLRVSDRVGCMARLVIHAVAGKGFVVHLFEEKHTHPMCDELSTSFMKVNRKLNLTQKLFIANCAKANIGPVKAHRLYKEIVGDYAHVGGIGVDFNNFKTDLLAKIKGADAELVIDKFLKKRAVCSAFFYDYDMDEKERLRRLFWSDPVGRKNCSIYGDVVSFDATYRTNRYNLVFVLFTGVDNHKRCVTFGAGLLTKEDVPSYIWLLECFKKAMGHEPTLLVTDQDPAMKIAISQVFPNSRHRFCMWHILMKVGEKLGKHLGKDEVFRKKLCDIVWSETSKPASFEQAWNAHMEEYNLTDHPWFSQLFALRQFWIPGFFHDLFMGGLVRTTSRCEGENSFFNSFTTPHSTLVEFIMHFETSIDAQRHEQAKLNAKCDGSFPVVSTPLAIERHTSEVYTINIFYLVQEEICQACYYCCQTGVRDLGDTIVYDVKDSDQCIWVVEHELANNRVSCSCVLFERVGYLCRHAFFVLKNLDLKFIPERYVVPRWTRAACLRSIFHIDGAVIDQTAEFDVMKLASNQTLDAFYTAIGLAEGNKARFEQLTHLLRDQAQSFRTDSTGAPSHGYSSTVIDSFCGQVSSSCPTVFPPV